MSVYAIQIAQAKLYDVLQGIDENKHPEIHKNARTISLFFYIENSVEEARRKLLSGVNKNNYAMPPKEERQKLIRREKELYNKMKKSPHKTGLFHFITSDEHEVVGNVYDSSELLQGGKK